MRGDRVDGSRAIGKPPNFGALRKLFKTLHLSSDKARATSKVGAKQRPPHERAKDVKSGKTHSARGSSTRERVNTSCH